MWCFRYIRYSSFRYRDRFGLFHSRLERLLHVQVQTYAVPGMLVRQSVPRGLGSRLSNWLCLCRYYSTTLIYVLTFYISCKMEDLACCALRIFGLVMDLCCPLCIQIRGSFFPCVLCNSHVYCEHIVPVSILKHVHT